MPDFLIIAPTVHEAAPFFAALDPRKKPALGACARAGNAACVVSGIGCEKSAERVEAAAKEFRPRAVILAGFGGACKADLKKGDLVYETRSEELAALGSRLRGVRGKIAFTFSTIFMMKVNRMRSICLMPRVIGTRNAIGEN